MSVLALLAIIAVIGWGLWYIEEHDPTENRMINKMVRRDKISQKKRGDIVKEARTRVY